MATKFKYCDHVSVKETGKIGMVVNATSRRVKVMFGKGKFEIFTPSKLKLEYFPPFMPNEVAHKLDIALYHERVYNACKNFEF